MAIQKWSRKDFDLYAQISADSLAFAYWKHRFGKTYDAPRTADYGSTGGELNIDDNDD